jgi:hypothetical protein
MHYRASGPVWLKVFLFFIHIVYNIRAGRIDRILPASPAPGLQSSSLGQWYHQLQQISPIRRQSHFERTIVDPSSNEVIKNAAFLSNRKSGEFTVELHEAVAGGVQRHGIIGLTLDAIAPPTPAKISLSQSTSYSTRIFLPLPFFPP